MSRDASDEIRSNQDCNWEDFDCDAYVAKNYAQISPPDRAILEQLVKIHKLVPLGGAMVEIGAGPNLYPLMAASVYRDQIHVTDISAKNLEYIQRHVSSPSLMEPWKTWLGAVRALDPSYERLGFSLELLKRQCTFEQLSIFDLSAGRYDFSSMHFVAESITNDYDEFVSACDRAIGCLKRGGWFAASFMLSSEGYRTGSVEFPAVAVDEEGICRLLSDRCTEFEHIVLEGQENVVREGHTGILLAHGMR